MSNKRRSIVAACCLAVAAGSALAGEPAGLVARYRGENDATDSLGTRNGTEQGTVAYAPGVEGQAFSFAGAGYVEVAAPNLDATRSGFTVAAWIRMDSFSSGAPVANLAHSASFHPWPNIAPSNPGTKHLVVQGWVAVQERAGLDL